MFFKSKLKLSDLFITAVGTTRVQPPLTDTFPQRLLFPVPPPPKVAVVAGFGCY